MSSERPLHTKGRSNAGKRACMTSTPRKESVVKGRLWSPARAGAREGLAAVQRSKVLPSAAKVRRQCDISAPVFPPDPMDGRDVSGYCQISELAHPGVANAVTCRRPRPSNGCLEEHKLGCGVRVL